MLFFHLRKFHFSNFKMTFAKVLIKKSPFVILDFQSSYKVILIDKVLLWKHFEQYNGSSMIVFPFFLESSFFLLINISVAFYDNGDIKMVLFCLSYYLFLKRIHFFSIFHIRYYRKLL